MSHELRTPLVRASSSLQLILATAVASFGPSEPKGCTLTLASPLVRPPVCSIHLKTQNTIIGFTSLALEEQISEAASQHMSNVLAGASSLLYLVQNVLEFSSLDPAGALGAESLLRMPKKHTVAHERFTAGEIADDVANEVGPTALARGVELVVSVAPRLYAIPTLEGDATQIRKARWESPLLFDAAGLPFGGASLESPSSCHFSCHRPQVLLALCDNACKATPPGGEVTVRLAIAPMPACGGDDMSIRAGRAGLAAEAAPPQAPEPVILLEAWVKDTGCGIPQELAPILMQPFAKFSHAPNLLAKGDGAGLGLAIAKARVDRMQGTITFESTVGAHVWGAVALLVDAFVCVVPVPGALISTYAWFVPPCLPAYNHLLRFLPLSGKGTSFRVCVPVLDPSGAGEHHAITPRATAAAGDSHLTVEGCLIDGWQSPRGPLSFQGDASSLFSVPSSGADINFSMSENHCGAIRAAPSAPVLVIVQRPSLQSAIVAMLRCGGVPGHIVPMASLDDVRDALARLDTTEREIKVPFVQGEVPSVSAAAFEHAVVVRARAVVEKQLGLPARYGALSTSGSAQLPLGPVASSGPHMARGLLHQSVVSWDSLASIGSAAETGQNASAFLSGGGDGAGAYAPSNKYQRGCGRASSAAGGSSRRLSDLPLVVVIEASDLVSLIQAVRCEMPRATHRPSDSHFCWCRTLNDTTRPLRRACEFPTTVLSSSLSPRPRISSA